MKPLSPFASFERGLKVDHEAEESRKLEVLGIEPEKPPGRKRGRKPLDHSTPHATLAIPGDLVEQADRVAKVMGISRANAVRVCLSAAMEAVILSLEASGKVALPLTLRVRTGDTITSTPHVRTLSPDRLQSLRSRRAGVAPSP